MGDAEEKLEAHCRQYGLEQPVFQESARSDHYESLVTVGSKRALARAKSPSSAREKAALRWIKAHGSSSAAEVSSRGRDRSTISIRAEVKKSTVPTTADVKKSTIPTTADVKKSTKSQEKIRAAGSKRVASARDYLDTSDEDDSGDPSDDFTKDLLSKVFGSSPKIFGSRKSDSKKKGTDKPLQSTGSEKSSSSTKTTIFSVFKKSESRKTSEREEPSKFQFKQNSGLKKLLTKNNRKDKNQNSHKPSKFDKNLNNDDIYELLDSSSDSEPYQRFNRKDEEDLEDGQTSGSEINNSNSTVCSGGALSDSEKNKPGLRKEKAVKSKSSIFQPKISKQVEECPPQDTVEITDEDEDEFIFDVFDVDDYKRKPRDLKKKSLKVEKGKVEQKRRNGKSREKSLPSIDDLLKLPDDGGGPGKNMDDILDEVDEEIKAKQAKHEEEMKMLDRNLELLKARKEERKKRLAVNAMMKRRLVEDLTKPVLRSMFTKILPYLEDIKAGRVLCDRHVDFHTNAGTRQALFYQMINHPFTSEQVDWTYEEMARIWTRNSKEYHDNNDYIWKVLMPECLTKFYMDVFSLSREEAVRRIRETPMDEDSDDSD